MAPTIPHFLQMKIYGGCIWTGSVNDIRRLKHGLVFKTKEEAVVAAEKMLAAINER